MMISEEQKAKRREAHKAYMRNRRASDPDFLAKNANFNRQKYHSDPEHRKELLTKQAGALRLKMQQNPEYRAKENARKREYKRKKRYENGINAQFEYFQKREQELFDEGYYDDIDLS